MPLWPLCGSWWYYLNNIQYLYGYLSVILIPAGLVTLFWKIRLGTNVKLAILAFPVIIYLFFSFARTKMGSYSFVISMPVFIAMACVMDVIIDKALKLNLPSFFYKVVVLLFLLLVFASNIRVVEIIENHSLQNT